MLAVSEHATTDATSALTGNLIVVENWLDELQRLVPTP